MAIPMNWVERRAHGERLIEAEAPALWNSIRAAIQDACASFQQCYPARADTIECALENGNRILITRKTQHRHDPQPQREDILVEYKKASGLIEVTDEEQSAKHRFRIAWDDGGVFIQRNHERVDADTVSRDILEPLLFPRTR